MNTKPTTGVLNRLLLLAVVVLLFAVLPSDASR
jgi:hypothetical protein